MAANVDLYYLKRRERKRKGERIVSFLAIERERERGDEGVGRETERKREYNGEREIEVCIFLAGILVGHKFFTECTSREHFRGWQNWRDLWLCQELVAAFAKS